MNRRVIALGVAALGTIAVGLMPFIVSPYLERLLVSAGVFILLAIAWNLMAGFAGLMSFGLAGFFGIGAYTFAVLTINTELPLLVKYLIAALAAAALAFVLVPVFRARGVYFAISTLAIAESLRVLANNFFPGGNAGLYFSPSFDIRGHEPYWWVIGAVVVVLALSYWISRSVFGRELAAVKGDPIAAESLGVNVLSVRLRITLISSGVGGLAGAMLASVQSFVDPATYFSVSYSLVPLLMVIVGGIGTVAGPIVGAIGWRALDEVIRSMTTSASAATVTAMIYGVVLMVFAVFAPRGLVGLAKSIADRVTRRRSRRPVDSGIHSSIPEAEDSQ